MSENHDQRNGLIDRYRGIHRDFVVADEPAAYSHLTSVIASVLALVILGLSASFGTFWIVFSIIGVVSLFLFYMDYKVDLYDVADKTWKKKMTDLLLSGASEDAIIYIDEPGCPRVTVLEPNGDRRVYWIKHLHDNGRSLPKKQIIHVKSIASESLNDVIFIGENYRLWCTTLGSLEVATIFDIRDAQKKLDVNDKARLIDVKDLYPKLLDNSDSS